MIRVLQTISIAALILAFAGCHDKEEDPCHCKSNETCIHDTYTGIIDCYENGSYYHLGGQLYHATNLYVGIINNNLCIDTLIFYNDTLQAPDKRFGLLANVYPWGVYSLLGGYPPHQAGENEFYSFTNDRICFLNGEDWYANLHFKVYPDSVWMKLGFWTMNGEPGVLIDSATVMFHKP